MPIKRLLMMVMLPVLIVVLFHPYGATAFIGAPEIRLGSVTPLVKGKDYTIQASVTDEYGIEKVVLHYRRIGDETYKTVLMRRQGESTIYAVTLGSKALPEPGIQYYVRAVSMTGAVSVMPGRRQMMVEIVYKHLKGKKQQASGYKWLMIGVGILAAGALASGGGGGGGGNGSSSSEPTADVTITTALPGGGAR